VADKIIVNSDLSLANFFGVVSAKYQEHKHLTITIREGVDRTVQVNNLWQAMYKRLADYKLFCDSREARSYCKLMIGVPILLSQSAEFREGWNRIFRTLGYEEQVRLMGANSLFGPNGFPVTSLFNRKQGSEYVNNIADHSTFVERRVNFGDLLGV